MLGIFFMTEQVDYLERVG